MIIAPMNAAQLALVKTQPGVQSIWANRIMKPFTNESRRFIGVPQMMADRDVQRANNQNPGMPISGKGIGIGYIDTGIDATHSGFEVWHKDCAERDPASFGDDRRRWRLAHRHRHQHFRRGLHCHRFQPSDLCREPTALRRRIGTRNTRRCGCGGHRRQSGNFYGGVAPGAHLIGLNAGNELGLPLVTILGAYDYLLVNQFLYNIRDH